MARRKRFSFKRYRKTRRSTKRSSSFMNKKVFGIPMLAVLGLGILAFFKMKKK